MLLEGTPSDVNTTELRKTIAGVPCVVDVHDLHVWSLTSGVNGLSVHVVSAGDTQPNKILKVIRERIKESFKIAHPTIQVEQEGYQEGETHL